MWAQEDTESPPSSWRRWGGDRANQTAAGQTEWRALRPASSPARGRLCQGQGWDKGGREADKGPQRQAGQSHIMKSPCNRSFFLSLINGFLLICFEAFLSRVLFYWWINTAPSDVPSQKVRNRKRWSAAGLLRWVPLHPQTWFHLPLEPSDGGEKGSFNWGARLHTDTPLH